MNLVRRAAISVRPEDAFVVDGFFSLDYQFGASNQNTIRYGYVQSTPRKGFKWLKKGDKVWFNAQLCDNQIFDNRGSRGNVILPQEDGEVWGVTEGFALDRIMGIERNGKLISSPNFLTCIPKEIKPDTFLIVPDSAIKESETEAICIDNKENYKEGDVIHFRINCDYPAKEMKSEWLKHDGKRVIFIRKEGIFGKQRGSKFYSSPNWVITKPLDEGDPFVKQKSGLYIHRKIDKNNQLSGKVLYSNKMLKSGAKIRYNKKQGDRFKLKGEAVDGVELERIWYEFN